MPALPSCEESFSAGAAMFANESWPCVDDLDMMKNIKVAYMRCYTCIRSLMLLQTYIHDACHF